jgi:hypothetical protein
MRAARLTHEFVDHFPDVLAEGVLYVSLPFASVAHLCCCGCGNEVVTPLTPHDWQLAFDGETISLTPSIGNWSFGCQSHYWVTRGQVRWAPKWTPEQVASGRSRARGARSLSENKAVADNAAQSASPTPPTGHTRVPRWLKRLFRH